MDKEMLEAIDNITAVEKYLRSIGESWYADFMSDTEEILNGFVEDPNNGWISVKDRLPVETHSMFYRFYRTQKWSNAMWREQSDKVLVTVAFKDGTKIVTTGKTLDGVWDTTISRTLEPVVTHWMPLPEPPKEEG